MSGACTELGVLEASTVRNSARIASQTWTTFATGRRQSRKSSVELIIFFFYMVDFGGGSDHMACHDRCSIVRLKKNPELGSAGIVVPWV